LLIGLVIRLWGVNGTNIPKLLLPAVFEKRLPGEYKTESYADDMTLIILAHLLVV
jgi:hypothetical protein